MKQLAHTVIQGAALASRRSLPGHTPSPHGQHHGHSYHPKHPAVCLLHGIFGSSRNLVPFARKIAELPVWRDLTFVVVDQRCHGDSAHFSSAHHSAPSVEACSQDVSDFFAESDYRPEAIIGHSFGGKVALQIAASFPTLCPRYWIWDSLPGLGDTLPKAHAEQDASARIFEFVQAHPGPFVSRQQVAGLAEKSGFSQNGVVWLSGLLAHAHAPVREGAGSPEKALPAYHWRFNLDGVLRLKDSYLATDVWHVLEAPPPAVQSIDFVYGSNSGRWSPDNLQRLVQCDSLHKLGSATTATAGTTAVRVHELRDSGHWVYTDNARGLLDLLGRFPPRATPPPLHA